MNQFLIDEAKRILLEKTVKQFNFHQLTRNRHHKTLTQLIGRYPGNGIGFKVKQKHWAKGEGYWITDIKFLVSQTS